MTDRSPDPESLLARRPHDSWAVAVLAALIVFIIIGVLPHVIW